MRIKKNSNRVSIDPLGRLENLITRNGARIQYPNIFIMHNGSAGFLVETSAGKELYNGPSIEKALEIFQNNLPEDDR